jgi:FtsZ-binding cell division protein ZapB
MSSQSSSVRRPRQVAPPELDRLELTIHRLLEAHDAWQHRADTAAARIAELEDAVRSLSSGGLDPVALAQQVERLEAENLALRARIAQAQENVQRMLARLHYVEEER